MKIDGYRRFGEYFALLLGVIIGRGMMRTPLDMQSAYISTGVMLMVRIIIFLYVYKKYGLGQTQGIVIISLLGIGIEYLGIKTCFPYGCFQYSELVGPKFFGTFPFSLLAIRPVVVLGIIQWIPRSKNMLYSALSGGLGLMIFDLFLDPVAVHQGLWEYTTILGDIIWYGVPLSNFMGWILTGTLSVWCILRRSPKLVGDYIFRVMGGVLIMMYVFGFITIM